MNNLQKLIQEIIQEQKRDRCLRIADRKYDKPSAYKSGAVVRCRKGDIWKDLKEGYVLSNLEDEYDIKLDVYSYKDGIKLDRIIIPKDKRKQGIGSKVMDEIIQYADREQKPIYLTPSKDFGASSIERLEKFYKKFGFVKKPKSDFSTKETMVRYPVTNLQEDESLRKWFKRQGTPGKEGGWVDCNAPIRKDGKVTGYKSCGRKEGEKRAEYPSCRPTAAKCKDKGKGKTWGKTK